MLLHGTVNGSRPSNQDEWDQMQILHDRLLKDIQSIQPSSANIASGLDRYIKEIHGWDKPYYVITFWSNGCDYSITYYPEFRGDRDNKDIPDMEVLRYSYLDLKGVAFRLYGYCSEQLVIAMEDQFGVCLGY